MSNRTYYIRDLNRGILVPIRYVDNGDGTYSVAQTSENNSMTDIIVYEQDGNSGDLIPVKYAYNGDGTYSRYVSGGISNTNLTDLTDGGDSTLHYHAADRARANHTGTQLASTVSDFSEAVDDRVAALIQNGTGITWSYNDASGLLTPSISAVSGLLESIIDQLASGSDPIDFKISNNDYIVFGFFTRSTTSGWLDATNAVHTVTAGKTLKVLMAMGNNGVVADNASRQARLRNTTDGTDILANNVLMWPLLPVFLDISSTGAFPTAAAGKTVKLGLWNTNSTGRAIGALVIAKEV